MIIMIPLMQLLLFGYAINTTPRDLPTAVLLQEIERCRPLDPDGAARTPNISRSRSQVRDEAEFDRLLAVRRGAVRDRDPARISSARCGAATGRRCWWRPMRPIRWRRARRSARSASWCRPRSRTTAACPTAARRRSRSAPTRATIRPPRPQLNIVPGLRRHHPHHDHADLHGAVGDARDRARHHGEPAVDADHAGRDHARQDRALRAGRLRAGGADHRRRRAAVRRADRRQPAAAGGCSARCSSPPICRSATPSRPWRRTSCRRCRCR